MAEHQLYTISDAEATRLTPLGKHSGMDITLQNVSSSGYVYIGGEGVSSSNYGYKLAPGHAFSVELPGSDAVYAIASADNVPLAVLRFGLESQD